MCFSYNFESAFVLTFLDKNEKICVWKLKQNKVIFWDAALQNRRLRAM